VPSDETWQVLRAQTGDREALNDLLAGIQHGLYRFILSVVSDRALAEDVLQEVFLRIYRKLTWLDDPAAFRAWAYRIASREAFRLLKRERRWSARQSDEALLESLPAAAEDPPPLDFARLVDNASPASRAVLTLHYLEGMSLDEVAAVLGIALGTVKSRLAYGLSALRRAAKENGLG